MDIIIGFVSGLFVNYPWAISGMILLSLSWFAIYKIKVPARPTPFTKTRIRTIQALRIAGIVLLGIEIIPLLASWFVEVFEWLEERPLTSWLIVFLLSCLLGIFVYRTLKKASK